MSSMDTACAMNESTQYQGQLFRGLLFMLALERGTGQKSDYFCQLSVSHNKQLVLGK